MPRSKWETDRFKCELSEWLATFGDRALLSFDHSFFEGWTEEMSDLHDDVTGAFKRRHEQMVPQLNSAIDLAVNLPGPTDSQLLEIVSGPFRPERLAVKSTASQQAKLGRRWRQAAEVIPSEIQALEVVQLAKVSGKLNESNASEIE